MLRSALSSSKPKWNSKYPAHLPGIGRAKPRTLSTDKYAVFRRFAEIDQHMLLRPFNGLLRLVKRVVLQPLLHGDELALRINIGRRRAFDHRLRRPYQPVSAVFQRVAPHAATRATQSQHGLKLAGLKTLPCLALPGLAWAQAPSNSASAPHQHPISARPVRTRTCHPRSRPGSGPSDRTGHRGSAWRSGSQSPAGSRA